MISVNADFDFGYIVMNVPRGFALTQFPANSLVVVSRETRA